MHGQLSSGRDWQIAVREPRQGRQGFVCALYLSGGVSAVTSGDYERFRIVEKLTITHTLNAVSGFPYNISYNEGVFKNTADHIISVTIMGADAMHSDIYATVAKLLGIERAVGFLKHRGVDALIFTKDYRMAAVGNVQFIDDIRVQGYREFLMYTHIA